MKLCAVENYFVAVISVDIVPGRALQTRKYLLSAANLLPINRIAQVYRIRVGPDYTNKISGWIGIAKISDPFNTSIRGQFAPNAFVFR